MFHSENQHLQNLQHIHEHNWHLCLESSASLAATAHMNATCYMLQSVHMYISSTIANISEYPDSYSTLLWYPQGPWQTSFFFIAWPAWLPHVDMSPSLCCGERRSF